MNILILTEKYPPDAGGLAVSTQRLAHGLARTGHAVCVSVLCDSAAPGGVVEVNDAGLTVFRVGAQRRPDDTSAAWFDHVVALDAGRGFNIIHAMYVTRPAFVAVTAARYLGRPSVVSARGNDLDRTAFDPGKFSQIVWALHNASAITAVSADLARRVCVFAPGVEARIIPNGVDTAHFGPGPRDEALADSLGLTGVEIVAFVGEARQKKGLTVLLPAFARACARSDRKLALLMVGGVRQDDAPVLEVFRRQNPALDICLVPAVCHAELTAYYRLADVLVVPSLRDGMPNALLEGMACEKAVVASQVGGISDVLCRAGTENGVLVPPGDVTALGDALLALLADPPLCTRLGRAARLTVVSDFTPAQEIERNMEVYRSLWGY
jgi:glycosyltransferase involved in cell wall biosynthesis